MAPSWARFSASFGSFFVSPGSNLTFSSSNTSPGPSAPQVRSTAPSIPPGASFTSVPSSSPSRFATGAIESAGSRSPFGRPRCDIRTSAAPRSRSSSIVGSAARMRVSSATTHSPPSSLRGTLKSTLTRTRRPFTGALRTLALPNPIYWSNAPLGQDLARQLDAAVGVAPLVVVPADCLHHPAVADHHRLAGVEDRGGRVADDVGRDDRVLGVGKDSPQRTVGGGLDDLVYLLRRNRVRRREGEVDDRAGRDRSPHRE